MQGQQEKKSPRSEQKESMVVGVVLLAFAMFVAIDAWRLAQESGFELSGPATFPLVIGAGLVATSVAFLVGVSRGKDAGLFEYLANERIVSELRPVFPVLGCLVAYAFLLPWVGYAVTTTLLFVVTARILGSRRWVLNVIIGVAMAVFIYYAFTELLHVRLPLGSLWEG